MSAHPGQIHIPTHDPATGREYTEAEREQMYQDALNRSALETALGAMQWFTLEKIPQGKKSYELLSEPLDPEKLLRDPGYRHQVERAVRDVKLGNKGGPLTKILLGVNPEEYVESLKKTEEVLTVAKKALAKHEAISLHAATTYELTAQHTYGLSEKEAKRVVANAQKIAKLNPLLQTQTIISQQAEIAYINSSWKRRYQAWTTLNTHTRELKTKKQEELKVFKSSDRYKDLSEKQRVEAIQHIKDKYEQEAIAKTRKSLGFDEKLAQFRQATITNWANESVSKSALYNQDIQNVATAAGVTLNKQEETKTQTTPSAAPPGEISGTTTPPTTLSPAAPIHEDPIHRAQQTSQSPRQYVPAHAPVASPHPTPITRSLQGLSSGIRDFMKSIVSNLGSVLKTGLSKGLRAAVSLIRGLNPAGLASLALQAGLKVLGNLVGVNLDINWKKVAIYGGVAVFVIFILISGDGGEYFSEDMITKKASSGTTDLSWETFQKQNLIALESPSLTWQEFELRYLTNTNTYLSSR